MINCGFIQKKYDPIKKIKIDGITYFKTKDTKFLARLFESKTYLVFYVICTIYALFGDDFRQLFVSIRFDNFFYFLMSLTCIFFIADIIMSSIYSELYQFSVLFFMDVISVCFLLFDIGPINELFFNRISMNVYGVLARGVRAVSIGSLIFKQKQKYYVTRYGNNTKQQEQLQNKKQRRNANLFVPTSIESLSPDEFLTAPYNSQLMSQSNIIYIDKNKKPIDKNVYLQRTKSLNQQLGEKQVIEQVDSTSLQLTRSFQIKIILGMFILIYLLPIFWTHTYFSKLSSYKIGINHITTYIDNFEMDEDFNLIWKRYVDLCTTASDHYQFIKLELFLKDENGQYQLIKQEGDLKQLDQIKKEYRYYEIVVYTSKKQSEILVGQHYIRGIWQKRKKVNLDSWLSICRTIFFLVIIIALGIFMSKDINDYFAIPFFNLMSKVNMIHANPMDAWHQFEDDSQDLIKNKKYTEIDLLRRSLVESSKLLQIGLGEAGNEVVIQNLKFNTILDNSQTSLRNDLKAKKIYSIFGFVYINKFQQKTELLLEDVFDFVNSIANIVHQNVQKLNGNVNKNIGEAFLIVWKIKNQHASLIENAQQEYKDEDIPKDLRQQVENSIYAFIKIVLEFKFKNPHEKYTKILQKFKSKDKLSLGLHLGWAIEGAIGSKHKIDVSYLSPHVNLASRVTAVTMQYRVPLLISFEVVKFASKKYRDYMRRVDRVFLKGSKKGILLYTFDMDLSSDCIQSILANNQFKTNLQFQEFVQSLYFKKLKSKYKIKFKQNWKKGFDNYQIGKWKKAQYNLNICLQNIGNDGPTLNLYKFMQLYEFRATDSWNGIRSLLKK